MHFGRTSNFGRNWYLSFIFDSAVCLVSQSFNGRSHWPSNVAKNNSISGLSFTHFKKN